jgi:hydroxylamine reductase (hybrid-cluster protein)
MNVIVSWTQPFNGGSSITSYKVFVQAADFSWQQDNTNCNGSNGAIVSARQCTIPVTVLRAAPFSLSNTSDVIARVVATNVFGDS